jgi:hypothetical protein
MVSIGKEIHMPRYELTDELREALGTVTIERTENGDVIYHPVEGVNQREQMACRHAKFLLEKVSHERAFMEAPIRTPFNWKGMDGKPGLTCWEIEIGQRLARLLKKEYLKEQAVLAKIKADEERRKAEVAALKAKNEKKEKPVADKIKEKRNKGKK